MPRYENVSCSHCRPGDVVADKFFEPALRHATATFTTIVLWTWPAILFERRYRGILGSSIVAQDLLHIAMVQIDGGA